MTELLQYPVQAFIDPEALGEPGATVDTGVEWHVPWQDQTHARQGLLTTDQLAFATDPESLGDPLDDKLEWFQVLAEPVLPRAQVNDAANIFVDEVTAPVEPDELQWFRPFSVPDKRRQWQRTEFWVSDPATLDAPLRDELQWYRSLDTPVFVRQQTLSDWLHDDIVSLGAGVPDDSLLWTPVTPSSDTWAVQSPDSSTWTPETPETTTWS